MMEIRGMMISAKPDGSNNITVRPATDAPQISIEVQDSIATVGHTPRGLEAV